MRVPSLGFGEPWEGSGHLVAAMGTPGSGSRWGFDPWGAQRGLAARESLGTRPLWRAQTRAGGDTGLSPFLERVLTPV